jgi:hypothetical protein
MFEQHRFFYGPFQQLLPAHAAANTNVNFFNTQLQPQRLVSPYHVAGSKQRKFMVPGFAAHGVYI